jgi:hypothetical protein
MNTVQEMNKKQYENELKMKRLYEDVHVESSTKDSCKLEAQVAVKLVILGKAAEGTSKKFVAGHMQWKT